MDFIEKIMIIVAKILTKICEALKKLADFISIKNIRKYQLKQEVKLTLLISIIFYACCFYALGKLKYVTAPDYYVGIGVVIVYFIPLVLLVVNSFLFIYEFKEERKIIKKPMYLELAARCIAFLVSFTNYQMLNIKFEFKYKFAIVSCASLISLLLIIYTYFKARNVIVSSEYKYLEPITKEEIEKIKNGKDGISTFAIILYIYSIGFIGTNITYLNGLKKVFAFALACKLIKDKLTDFYPKEIHIKRKVVRIIIFMVIGFMINLVFAVLLALSFIHNTRDIIQGIKELAAVLAILCLIPLVIEYKKIGIRSTEIRHYMRENGIEE
ncbi:MAG: hypothetical protein GX895_08135 [Clostridiales bacterium]|nr:hypothetical protein [Clostridiales bacterium]